MKIVVLKFGGTSVGTIKKIKKVAEIITDYKKKNYKVIYSRNNYNYQKKITKSTKDIRGIIWWIFSIV